VDKADLVAGDLVFFGKEASLTWVSTWATAAHQRRHLRAPVVREDHLDDLTGSSSARAPVG
jgi:hypothetical protein